jgi:hypothetical protein
MGMAVNRRSGDLDAGIDEPSCRSSRCTELQRWDRRRVDRPEGVSGVHLWRGCGIASRVDRSSAGPEARCGRSDHAALGL